MAIPGFDSLVTCTTGASVSATGFQAMNGIKNFTISDSRDLLDITDFTDQNIRARMAALRDVSLDLSGDLEAADVGWLRMRAAYDTGDTCAVQVFVHATSGNFTATYGFAYAMKVESMEISAAVDGKPEVSISLKIDGSAATPILQL